MLIAGSRPREPAWRPHPDNIPQQLAWASLADELFYGGAAGGGKTDLICGLAIEGHHKSLIIRREATQLIDIQTRVLELSKSEQQSWNSTTRVLRLLDGRRIELGGCDGPQDHQKYKGRDHDLKAFDEGTDMREYQYLFINGWLRTVKTQQRTRTVLTGNPPSTDEGQWVTRRWRPWLDSDAGQLVEPGVLLWFAMIDGVDKIVDGPEHFEYGGEMIEPRSRTFIAASLNDNPYLRSSGYRAQVMALPEPLRSQLLYGDFMLKIQEDHPWQVIPTAWVRAAQERWKPEPPQDHMDRVGVDVARGGKDETVLVGKFGNWFSEPNSTPGSKTKDGSSVCAILVGFVSGAPVINIDSIGIGASAFDSIRQAGFPARPFVANAGSKATDRTGKLGFKNTRAAAWWKMREDLDPEHGKNLALPPGPEVRKELCAPRWVLMQGSILIEPKEEVKERIGKSPNIADAIIQANYEVNLGWARDASSLEKLVPR